MNRKIKDKISDEKKKVYGDRIRALRNRKGLKLEKFSEPLSVGFKTVSSYENGNAVASEAIVRELERIYLMNRNWYETGEGEMLLPTVTESSPVYSVTKIIEGIRPDQSELLQEWERLTNEERKLALDVMKSMKGRG
jgi:transcriptional regulator with XRE-family HTH domain